MSPFRALGSKSTISRLLAYSLNSPTARIRAIPHTQGGSTAELTLQIAANCQRYLGQEVLMHLTCTNLSVDSIKEALAEVRIPLCRRARGPELGWVLASFCPIYLYF